MHDRQEASEALMKQILGDSYQELQVETHVFEEDIAGGKSKIRAAVSPGPHGNEERRRRSVEGEGVGIVDAFFRGLIDQFSPEYPSLNTIRFVGFGVTAKLDPTRPRSASGSDAVAEVRLVVENSEGHQFEFTSQSRSITASALQATLDAVEYFVNSEMAFILTRRALKDAESRGRDDLKRTFQGRLAELVRNTSYSEAIAKEKESEGKSSA